VSPRAGLDGRKISDSIPDRPARSQSLYRLSYRAHARYLYNTVKHNGMPWIKCVNLGWKPERKREAGRHKLELEDNIKMNLK